MEMERIIVAMILCPRLFLTKSDKLFLIKLSGLVLIFGLPKKMGHLVGPTMDQWLILKGFDTF